ncbi:protein ORAOV1 homolog [Melanaphis sacchari]|uniref:protein ORAOV1 homolog n=1 Tax=Melanaphis sacchari TaxID=742174 RepID=UPI000DC1482F|nr:protein ORAOV1 homolog [Melanaphis sacchari]
MNDNTSFDYDNIIDEILMTEKHTAKKYYIEGIEKSSENAYNDGFTIGYQKGYDIGLEIGFYAGILVGIKKLHKSKIIILTEKELNILQKLSNFIEIFPQINDKNIIDQYNELKGLYKKFCFNLKIKNLDKRILNFSKWSN